MERRGQDQREDTIEAVSRLAGGLAHDFNNLFTSIIGYAHLILSHRQIDTPVRDAAAEIESAAYRAADLIRNLVAFSRRQYLPVSLVNMNEIVVRMADALEELMGRGREIRTSLAPHLGLVRTNCAQLEQALISIASNARESMPRGGTLTIETRNLVLGPAPFPGYSELPACEWVSMSVSDTGADIDEATASHLFDPYFTSRQIPAGSSLELAAIHGFVGQSGGYIEARPAPGGGTLIRIWLPRADAADGGPCQPG